MAEPAALKVGSPAPEINAHTTGGPHFRLSDNLGKWVLIYFYPRANTPG